ncbi:MAG TPA: hypothetical protein VE642_00580, partial [Pyrinomonadaceae bacterium]|nr:hypothetical protein [Pyrinomonadaceae bacterium]
ARPLSFDWSDGPRVAAETLETVIMPSSTRAENAAEILLSIGLIFSFGNGFQSSGTASSVVAPFVSVEKIDERD